MFMMSGSYFFFLFDSQLSHPRPRGSLFRPAQGCDMRDNVNLSVLDFLSQI